MSHSRRGSGSGSGSGSATDSTNTNTNTPRVITLTHELKQRLDSIRPHLSNSVLLMDPAAASCFTSLHSSATLCHEMACIAVLPLDGDGDGHGDEVHVMSVVDFKPVDGEISVSILLSTPLTQSLLPIITSTLSRYHLTCSSLTILTPPIPSSQINEFTITLQQHLSPDNDSDGWDMDMDVDVQIFPIPPLFTLVLPHAFTLPQHQYMTSYGVSHDITDLTLNLSQFLSSLHLSPDIFCIGQASRNIAQHLTTSSSTHNCSLLLLERHYDHVCTCLSQDHVMTTIHDMKPTSCLVDPMATCQQMYVDGDVGMLLQTCTYRNVDQTAKALRKLLMSIITREKCPFTTQLDPAPIPSVTELNVYMSTLASRATALYRHAPTYIMAHRIIQAIATIRLEDHAMDVSRDMMWITMSMTQQDSSVTIQALMDIAMQHDKKQETDSWDVDLDVDSPEPPPSSCPTYTTSLESLLHLTLYIYSLNGPRGFPEKLEHEFKQILETRVNHATQTEWSFLQSAFPTYTRSPSHTTSIVEHILSRLNDIAQMRGDLTTYDWIDLTTPPETKVGGKTFQPGYVSFTERVLIRALDPTASLADLHYHRNESESSVLDVKHLASLSSLGSLFKSKINTLAQVTPRPSQHKILVVFVIGGVSCCELRGINELAAAHPDMQLIVGSTGVATKQNALSSVFGFQHATPTANTNTTTTTTTTTHTSTSTAPSTSVST